MQLERAFQSHVLKVLGEVWLEVSARLQAFASLVSRDVETSLHQARLATGSGESMSFQLPQVPALNLAADSFEEAWTGLFRGGLFGLILGGPWAWRLLPGAGSLVRFRAADVVEGARWRASLSAHAHRWAWHLTPCVSESMRRSTSNRTLAAAPTC